MGMVKLWVVLTAVLALCGLCRGSQKNDGDCGTTLTSESREHSFLKAPDSDNVLTDSEGQDAKAFLDGCSVLPRYPLRPKSVHKLTPADIDMVAALGDSLTAGRAIKDGAVGLLFDYRGLAWSIGGDRYYDRVITMPNILKKYSNHLIGYSKDIGSLGRNLNLAKTGAKSADLLDQAKQLVEKMRTDKRYKPKFKDAWKVITIFIGGNDLCDFCHDLEKYSAQRYKANVERALDYLQANVPRTFVNLVNVFKIEILKNVSHGLVCDLAHKKVCKCIAYPKGNDREVLLALRAQYQQALRDLAASPKYDTREDFTVVLQPFFEDTDAPMNGTEIDQAFFAADCFHFSRLGQAAAGKALWNNMFQPIGEKRTDWGLGQPLTCPTRACPYLFTRRNSNTCR